MKIKIQKSHGTGQFRFVAFDPSTGKVSKKGAWVKERETAERQGEKYGSTKHRDVPDPGPSHEGTAADPAGELGMAQPSGEPHDYDDSTP